ncbi:hypothetical protein [Leisingera sp. JC11]|uniref:hypothetical protein n=1 Tax=Leisingera sp. JC11 TaxID=3042469 RepID=UPI0034565455
MTDFTLRAALIVPGKQVAAARRIAGALGWGFECYSVPLSASGADPATHWGLSTKVKPDFLATLTDAGSGTVPDGVDPADLAEVMLVLLKEVGPAETTDHVAQFEALATLHGLQRVQMVSEP